MIQRIQLESSPDPMDDGTLCEIAQRVRHSALHDIRHGHCGLHDIAHCALDDIQMDVMESVRERHRGKGACNVILRDLYCTI